MADEHERTDEPTEEETPIEDLEVGDEGEDVKGGAAGDAFIRRGDE